MCVIDPIADYGKYILKIIGFNYTDVERDEWW